MKVSLKGFSPVPGAPASPTSLVVKERIILDGSVERVFANADGSIRTDGGPSRVIYRKEDGSVELEEWWDSPNREGRPDDLPAAIRYHSNGNLHYRQWYENGLSHRDRGPAVIELDASGAIATVDYRRHGMRHRLEGPATSMPFLRYEGYCLNDETYSSHAELLAAFAAWDEEAIREELETSDYAELLTEGIEPRVIVNALVAGVMTSEGIREVANGSPVEWVRAYEEGRS